MMQINLILIDYCVMQHAFIHRFALLCTAKAEAMQKSGQLVDLRDWCTLEGMLDEGEVWCSNRNEKLDDLTYSKCLM